MPSNQKRREAARRHLERQLKERQAREAARRRLTLILSVAGTILLVLVMAVFITVVSGEDDKTLIANGSTPPPTVAPGECLFAKDGLGAKPNDPPPPNVPKTGIVTATMKTSQGDITLEMDRSKAPCTVGSFESLAKQKFYDSTKCHRLVPEGIFVLQCGSPGGQGNDGPGYSVPDEATGAEKYPKGTLALARTAAPNGGGAQFFIVYKDAPNLEQNLGNLQYTVFGKVTKGLDVVEKVAAGGVDAGGVAPKIPITIQSVTLTETPAASTPATSPATSPSKS